MKTNNALEEYFKRLSKLKEESNKYKNKASSVSKLRPIFFILICLTIFSVYHFNLINEYYILLPVLCFIISVFVHNRILKKIKTIQKYINYFNEGISRIKGKWHGTGNTKDYCPNTEHLYAKDLDIFGKGSLFEKLCTIKTSIGQFVLADFLLAPANKVEIEERQKAVQELKNDIDFRLSLYMIGDTLNNNINPEKLIKWSKDPNNKLSLKLWIVVLISTLYVITSTILALTGKISLFFFIPPLAIQYLLRLCTTGKVKENINPIQRIYKELETLSKALNLFENQNYKTNKLIGLKEKINFKSIRPSEQINKLYKLLCLLDSARNQIFAAFAYFLMWDIHIAFFIELWRKKYGSLVETWLSALGEMEALNALSCFTFENPYYTFPTILEDEKTFIAENIGHPLIEESRCVLNNITIDKNNRMCIISGSNMSGKSTFLRTIGVNTVLAMCGAPVNASKLELPVLHVGASIRREDSLEQGASRFYIEIKHLKNILDAVKLNSFFIFLFDEIFNGTNSHDRRIGAEAFIKELDKKHAMGFITTHDLALTKLEESIKSIRNMHFKDNIKNKVLSFDYKLNMGIIKKSNALELMNIVGLI